MPEALRAALGLLTILPVGSAAAPGRAGGTLLWFPVTGAVIGLVLLLVFTVLGDAPSTLSAALLLAAWVILTGVLHIDGLADSADALVGGLGDRERTLRIMKDAAAGPAAVTAVAIVLIVKFAALGAVLTEAGAAVVLLCVPMIARGAVIALYRYTGYAGTTGMGVGLIDDARHRHAPGVMILGAAAVLLLAGGRGLVAVVAVAAVLLVIRHLAIRRLGGINGDVTGAFIELAEAAALVTFALYS